MRRQLALIGIGAALTFSLCGTAAAVPGNGANGLLIFNDCDSGVGAITLVNQGSLNGLFATAHVVGSNRPVPLISLEYDLYIGGELIESGGYAHKNPQQGQPVVTCNGSFAAGDLTFVIEVTGFFPAGA